MRTVTSGQGRIRRLAILGASLTLAACGSSQNWNDESEYVTVGGTVSGFTSGTLALWNNGGDRLAIAANGPFTFPLSIANGSRYAVVVATQPAGLTCTVANGIGQARGNVTGVQVNCVPYSFTQRPLPAIYSTGKAINYSAYRTPEGPRGQEVPTDAQILEDLGLLHTAGYNLLRLFGAETPARDVVAEKILRLAQQNYPDMRFHLGVALGGLTSCSDTKNDFNIAYLISNLSRYPNVVAISVGNETSFYSKYMPLACLENYIRTIRSQVTQPVTADDDWTFYAGKSWGGGDRVEVKPDTILPLLDFASIHMYPISYTDWNWRQTDVPPGPERARAMMEESLRVAKAYYDEVASYPYRGAAGVTVSIAESMPIVIGETGWKAVQTNPASEIEYYAARPENQKWYVDLLYGGNGYPSWERSAGGPPTIFYFEATDEAWKGIDDGWGLWDESRTARYSLCGTPVGPACNADVYAGAGYYDPPPFATVTFDSPSVNYTLAGFEGAEDSQIVADPVGGANNVARVNRAEAAKFFAGTVVGTTYLSIGVMPFDASNTRMTVRVYSPAAGIRVRLKVEDSGNAARAVETEAVTKVANAWETLTFDFANPVAGTPALDPNVSYDRLIIFFNFGVTGATAGAQTYYFDDVTFIGGGGLPVVPFSDLSFDSPGVVYTLTGFNGAEDSSLQLDPTDTSNTVVRVNRSATADTYAGTTVSTGPSQTVGIVPFTATNTRMSVRVYSPAAGIPVRLKLEDVSDPGQRYVETEAVTTVANAWETLTFDFANPAPNTPALNLAYNYNRLVIFFNFGASGAQAGAQTFYFDDVLFVAGGGGSSGSTGTCAAPNCTDFSAASITFGVFENQGGGTVEIASDPNDAGNKVVKFVKKAGDSAFFGTTISGLAGPAELTAVDRTVTLRVYSPAVGTNFLLKLEGGPGSAIVEKDVATTVAGAWETLSFDLSAGPAGTYATVVLFPNGRSTVTADKIMYVDELKFPAAVTAVPPLVFASGYATNNLTVEGGAWGFYSDNFTDYTNTYAGGGFVDDNPALPAADTYVYLVVATSAPTTDGFMGIFTGAPGYTGAAPNQGVTLNGQTTIKIEIGMAAEWFQQPTNKALTVRLVGAQVYTDGSGGRCQILIDKPLTPTTADLTLYTISLGSMSLAQGCDGGGFGSGVTSLAQALAKPIGEVHVQAVFPQVNTTAKNGAGTEYPTGFTRGSVTFE